MTNPLFDESGGVIGIVVSTFGSVYLYQLTGTLPQNVDFAIKADYLINLLEMLPETTPAKESVDFNIESIAICGVVLRVTSVRSKGNSTNH